MKNSLTFTITDSFNIGGLDDVVMYGKFYVTFTDMKGNVYNLCVRGAGNYSQRLYETLASGRIPVYVESGGRLPFDHMHDYLSDPPFVYVTDLDKISETVVEFHETHDLKVQMDKCYELFKNHFTSEAQIRDFKKMVDGTQQ